ncbi:hypothetical protein [Nonomuraea sp. NPDC049684]|uniref:hypothetical protein n=1 Tax=Nonomuraea sp. NPDC049684 TaxID=3364356 RepID=UPI0037A64B2D
MRGSVPAVAQPDLPALVVQHHGAVRLPGDGEAGLGQPHPAHAVAEVAAEVGQVGQHQPGGGLGDGQPVAQFSPLLGSALASGLCGLGLLLGGRGALALEVAVGAGPAQLVLGG